MPTYGEKLVAELVKSLDRKKYYGIQEPTITGIKKISAYRNPDFVIVGVSLGVIILEVKDWVKLRGYDKGKVEIERRDGTIVAEDNPLKIAREYALNLSDRFKQLDDLIYMHRGQKKLKFPWMYAVAFPNIEQKIIQKFVDQGVWDEGSILAKEQLTEAKFERALHNIPSAWKLDHLISPSTREVIRAVLDPTIIISDIDGQPLGVETAPQTIIIQEPLKSRNPKQPTLLPIELLNENARTLAESTSVRLVRGVAGSGKSLVLARRAQYLAEQYPDLQILVLAFNSDLTADLERRISTSPNLKVTNFHKICSRIMGKKWRSPQKIEGWLNNRLPDFIEQNQLTTEFVADEIEWRKELKIYDNDEYLEIEREGRGSSLRRAKRAIINTIFDQYINYQEAENTFDWSDVPFLALAELENEHPLKHAYDVILIDEGQDFAPSWISVVRHLLKPGGNLFICDDPTQTLFRSFSWRSKGVEVSGYTRVLRVPFRCTREITLAAHSLISSDKNLSSSEEITEPDLTSYELISGEIPKAIKYHDIYQEVKFVEQNALNMVKSGIPANQPSYAIISDW